LVLNVPIGPLLALTFRPSFSKVPAADLDMF
jgi:hypothetical protein